MKILRMVVVALMLFGSCRQAQAQAGHKDYAWGDTWDDNPKLHTITTDLVEYPAVYVLHNRFMEVQIKQGSALSYNIEHKIIHINSNAGVEKFNKVYIPFHDGHVLVSLAVRAISPSGKITAFNRKNLKELKNVEGYGNFQIFAIEGVEAGGEVEYIYTTSSPPQSFGRFYLQQEEPVLESEVSIIFPDNLSFAAKAYNGLAQPSLTMFDQRRKNIVASAKNIPAYYEEEYDGGSAGRMRVDFKIRSNGNGPERMTWDNIAESIITNNYERGAGSKTAKLLKPLGLENMEPLQKVQAIEQFIKANFTVTKSSGEEFESTKTILEKKVANERGIVKLFMSCWETIGIVPELVICSNRNNGQIDPEFSIPTDITDVIFYFRTLDKYVVPDVPYYRLGAAPDYLAGSKAGFAAFIFSDNQVRYVKVDFDVIKPMSYTLNNQGIKSEVKFPESITKPDIQHETFWQGYRALLYRGIYHFASPETREEFLKDVTLSGIENLSIAKREVEGENIDLSVDPAAYMRVKTQCIAPSLIEQGGEDYLFSVGKIIGKQSELYQEKERQHDIEFNSISNYNHEIVIEIPKGYVCSGLEALKILNEVRNKENEVVMKFESGYELQGNRLIIKANEVYKVLNLPKSSYADFRKVINSAADFNKVVLVFHQAGSSN